MLLAAEQPMLMPGGGVIIADASDVLLELAEYLQVPVTPTDLLRWRGSTPLEEPLEGFTTPVDQGKIRQWGVCNFDHDDMEGLRSLDGGAAVATDQVSYNLTRRGTEWDLQPWCEDHRAPVMAHSPIPWHHAGPGPPRLGAATYPLVPAIVLDRARRWPDMRNYDATRKSAAESSIDERPSADSEARAAGTAPPPAFSASFRKRLASPAAQSRRSNCAPVVMLSPLLAGRDASPGDIVGQRRPSPH